MKIQDIKKLSEIKGFQTETFYKDGQEHIGISIKEYVWHWFYAFDSATGEAMFHHTYSSNTGKTKKGYQHKWNTYQFVERLIQKNIK
jgi:hypothetical protein